MARFTPKSVLDNNTSDVRIVQALMKQQDIYYGECDGVMTPYMANSLQRFNKTGFANEKVGEIHILTPNGSTLTNLGKRATGDYSDMKSIVKTGELLSCRDGDWKLAIIASEQMPFNKVDGKINPVAKELHKVLGDIWKEYYLPFRLNKDDFSHNEAGKVKLTIQFPKLRWLETNCEFTDIIPNEITRIITEQLAAIGFKSEEVSGAFIASYVGVASQLTQAESQKNNTNPSYSQLRHGDIIGLKKKTK